jgi:hypothetical protein
MAKRVSDKRVLRLIRGFLTAGVLADGLVGPTDEGTPQGGPCQHGGWGRGGAVRLPPIPIGRPLQQ